MKRALLISSSVILVTLLLASTGKSLRTESESQAGAAVEWEYLIVAGGNTNLSASGNDQYPRMRKAPDGSFTREQFPLERNLDKLGAQGWELVAVHGSTGDPVFYLKRPRVSGR